MIQSTATDVVTKGQLYRHLHLLRFVYNGKQVECTYEDGVVKSATLVLDDKGSFEYVNEKERQVLAEHIASLVGDSATITY